MRRLLSLAAFVMAVGVSCGVTDSGDLTTNTVPSEALSSESTDAVAAASSGGSSSGQSGIQGVTLVCPPDDGVSITAWNDHLGRYGDFNVQFPERWTDFTDNLFVEVATILDAATLEAAGYIPRSIVYPIWIVDQVDGPTLTVYRVPAVPVATSEAFSRTFDRVSSEPLVGRVTEIAPICVGDISAPVYSYEGQNQELDTSTGNVTTTSDVVYGWSTVFTRGDVFYWIDLRSPVAADLDLFDAILSTWEWWESAEWQIAPIAFRSASTATEADFNLSSPDPDTYTTSFSDTQPEIWAVFEVTPGIADWFEVTWRYQGAPIHTEMLWIESEWAWAGFGLVPSGSFTPGNYDVILLDGTGQGVLLPFTVK